MSSGYSGEPKLLPLYPGILLQYFPASPQVSFQSGERLMSRTHSCPQSCRKYEVRTEYMINDASLPITTHNVIIHRSENLVPDLQISYPVQRFIDGICQKSSGNFPA